MQRDGSVDECFSEKHQQKLNAAQVRMVLMEPSLLYGKPAGSFNITLITRSGIKTTILDAKFLHKLQKLQH